VSVVGAGSERRSFVAERAELRLRLAEEGLRTYEVPAASHIRTHFRALFAALGEGYVELAHGPRLAEGGLALSRDRLVALGSGTEVQLRRSASGSIVGQREVGHSSAEAAVEAMALSFAARGEEVFLAPAPRTEPRPWNKVVDRTHCLWVDIDADGALEILRRASHVPPPHLVVESRPGRAHAYWRLSEPLETGVRQLGDGREIPGRAVEIACGRLAHSLGADLQATDRARVMRLAGTPNRKVDCLARVVYADLTGASCDVRELVSHLPDPPGRRRRRKQAAARRQPAEDSLRGVAVSEYVMALCGVEIPASGKIRCPLPGHDEKTASFTNFEAHGGTGWFCFGCSRGSDVYDLAGLMLGLSLPLEGERFKQAKAFARERLGR